MISDSKASVVVPEVGTIGTKEFTWSATVGITLLVQVSTGACCGK